MHAKTKKRFYIMGIVLLFVTMLLSLRTIVFANAAENTSLITTRSDFIVAVANASEGDTLLVGDIDFNLEGTGAVNVSERIIISKSITIKSGKTNNEQAIFTGASFDVKGTTVAGEWNTVKFEGITFDEKINTATLTNLDWELSYDSLGTPISSQPLKSQYAVQFFGNLVADFEKCEFKNYMYTYGGALNAYYNSESVEYADNRNCSLSLSLNECAFTSNVALYGGGAIYLQANNRNIDFKAVKCVFYQNESGFVEHASGGGAIYSHGADVELVACDFNKNTANHYYGGEKPQNDTTHGGAVYCNGANASDGCSLIMRGCSVEENTASNGGGIAVVVMSKAVIDNCYIASNTAKPVCDDTRNVWGLSSGQGQGGGLYFDGTQGDVTVINSDIVDNYAECVFPAICHETSGVTDLLSVDIVLCTIKDNTCGTQMSEYNHIGDSAWKWFTYPGDVYELEYINVAGCIVIDEDFDENTPRYETPTAENNYNYFASIDKAVVDGYASEDSPRSIVASQIVPKECYSSYFDELGVIPFGDFHIGSNHKTAVKIVLNTSGGTSSIEQMDYVYGIPVELPISQKKWHSFNGWFDEDGRQITALHYVFAHNVDGFTLTAKYTNIFPYGKVIGWSVGSLVLIAGAILFAVYLSKRKKTQATIAIASTDEVVAVEKTHPNTSTLTERENQVLELLLQGKKRSEIAGVLFVSEETIKKQISSIYGKLGVTSRSELFALFK